MRHGISLGTRLRKPSTEEVMTRKHSRRDPHKDPVCGKRVNRNKAHIAIEHRGEEYLLCCPLCQAEFERNPDKYAR
jgi:YHS domain-containing protein